MLRWETMLHLLPYARCNVLLLHRWCLRQKNDRLQKRGTTTNKTDFTSIFSIPIPCLVCIRVLPSKKHRGNVETVCSLESTMAL